MLQVLLLQRQVTYLHIVLTSVPTAENNIWTKQNGPLPTLEHKYVN
jgi:hypothetical protein